MLIDFATCEVDDLTASADHAVRIFEKFQSRGTNEILRPKFDNAIHGSVVYINRFFPFFLLEELLITEPWNQAVLDIKVPGRLASLH